MRAIQQAQAARSGHSACVDDQPWIALGVDLRLTTTDEGGRSKPLGIGPYDRYQYRPDWHLPELPDKKLTGAPVLCFGNFPLALGDSTRAVIVPLYEGSLRLWHRVRPGHILKMHEAPRVCGIASVAWLAKTQHRIPENDETAFRVWTHGGPAPSQ